MTDEEIREYAAEKIAAATGKPASWYNSSAALFAQNGRVGMLRNANYGAVAFDGMADLEPDAVIRLAEAQACFRWGY